MTMSAADLRARLTPDCRAVIVTHLYGRLAALEDLIHIAEDRALPVIEDCAQAHGAERNGRKAGTWGALGCFSFYPTKNLGALGDAGAVVTSDPNLAGRVRGLRQYGWTSRYRSQIPGGMNSRLDEIQAAVLTAKLPFLEGLNMRRRAIAAAYTEALSDAGLTLPHLSGGDYVAHLYVLRTGQRDSWRERLAQRGVATDIHYPIPDYRQESLCALDLRCPPLPATERCSAEVVTLPCFPGMTDGEVAFVIDAVQSSRL
jgi:dTDP-4-amino-4,6-dideoxygalactose transaminase